MVLIHENIGPSTRNRPNFPPLNCSSPKTWSFTKSFKVTLINEFFSNLDHFVLSQISETMIMNWFINFLEIIRFLLPIGLEIDARPPQESFATFSGLKSARMPAKFINLTDFTVCFDFFRRHVGIRKSDEIQSNLEWPIFGLHIF